ncbi:MULTISPECIES: TetR/AcrR family transcriptional regulator [Rhodobacterales]|uniref:TetR/AcrR family transcriptional regulator n=1 Tax=Rhodobacterales TaxID=204455 RepID=UPI0032980469
MARPREFDTDEALAKAMDVFWEHGYADATLPDLLAGMNLTRGSLYKAFNDKKALYMRVLSRYDAQVVSGAVALLVDDDQEGWARIFQVFDSIEEAVRSGDQRGCLLCSAIAGPAAYDSDIETMATKSLERMLVGFETALADVVPPTMSNALAHHLVAQYVGMRVIARKDGALDTLGKSTAALKHIATRLSPND